MRRTIGLDLGSRRTKGIVFESGDVVERAIFESWSLDRQRIIQWVESLGKGPIGATGYSRRLAAQQFGARVITEMKAFALGIHRDFPKAKTVVDIGGQDAKVIKLGPDGTAVDFEMNDRCAAGTGKFFEIAAKTLGMELDRMPELALEASDLVPVSSTCAVFAESEIIGHMAEGADRPGIARGIYKSVADRLFNMLQRVGAAFPLLMVGGGANACLAAELSKLFREDETIRESPHLQIPGHGAFYGALGTAIYVGKETC